MEAEEERKRKETEDAERLRRKEMEKNFDKHGELKRLGGRVLDFHTDDGKHSRVSNPIMSFRYQEKSALRLVDPSVLQEP
jgi:hypothetical protein